MGRFQRGKLSLISDVASLPVQRYRAPDSLLNVGFPLQVARRCWSGSGKAEETICRAMQENEKLRVTLPNHVQDSSILDSAFNQ